MRFFFAIIYVMNNIKIKLILTLIIALVVPTMVFAQTLSGTNYSVEDSALDSGGETSSSTNYSSRDSISDIDSTTSSSTNYKNPSGFVPGAYPGVPGTPTLTNTGSILYNSLDFVINTGVGNQTDTTYAIAISSDDFVTTYFIQTDDTVGTTEAWQTYAGWNSGTGERVTGLLPSTAYKIKVKASYGTGSNAADTETAYSPTATATTSAPSLVFSIAGVGSGTCVENSGGSCPPGKTTTVTSTATSMGFGSLAVGDGNLNIAAQTITVTTNASGGYTATVQQDGNLRTSGSDSIPVVSGTNATPSAFDTGVVNGFFGYHTTDGTLCTGTTGRFGSDNDLYAALSLTPYEIACSSGPVTGEVTSLVYKLNIGTLQEAGNYQNVITYIATATY